MRIDIHHYHHIDGDSEERLARRVSRLAQRLHRSNDALESAIDEAVTNTGGQRRRRPQRQETFPMSTSDLEQAFANLEAETARNDELDASASTLFSRLADMIEQAKGDPARVQAIADRLRTSNDALATAISANTPQDTGGGEGGNTPA